MKAIQRTRTTDPHPARQRGIAAITAILVVAIATILAVNLAWELNLDIRRTENMLVRAQARQFAIGAEMIAADALRTDFQNDIDGVGRCDFAGEVWDNELQMPFEGGTVRGRLTDLQGRFNLNNLIKDGAKNKDAFKQFTRLLEVLGLDPDIAAKALDWIDPNQVAEIGGAEDGIYTSKRPPYRTADTWFTTTTELLAIDGMIDTENGDDKNFRTLERYVSALPPGGKINVNTAEDPVLQSMSTNPGSTNPADLRSNREYCDLMGDGGQESAFWNDAKDIVDKDFAQASLTVDSSYFQLKVLVTLGTSQLTMYSLLYRDAGGVVTTALRYFDTK
jgi:general secretion pathway protein K